MDKSSFRMHIRHVKKSPSHTLQDQSSYPRIPMYKIVYCGESIIYDFQCDVYSILTLDGRGKTHNCYEITFYEIFDILFKSNEIKVRCYRH